MNRINRKLEYALVAIKCVADKPQGALTSTKEICESTGVPFDATARVMQIMAAKGLLKSEQGVRGGYRLVKPLDSVSFYELIEMLIGPMAIAKCLHQDGLCELTQSCNIVSPVERLNRKLANFYSKISLDEILFGSQKGSV